MEELRLGNVTEQIKPSSLPDGTGRFLYFNTNNLPKLVDEAARLIAERINGLKVENPYFVTPETSTIAIAHVLRTKFGLPGLILSKRRKPDDSDLDSVEYCAATATEARTLYLPKEVDLSGKDIFIIDNVTTTAETLRAVGNLLVKRTWGSRLVEAIVMFTEGKRWDSVQLHGELDLKIHSFGHIPILPNLEGSEDQAQYIHFSGCGLPTDFGVIEFNVFKHRLCEVEAICCVGPKTFANPDIQCIDGKWQNIPLRIHDACITSEAFHSVKCDCKLQLDKALEYISEYGGMVVYLQQEGRGIGLGNKIAAYNLQETEGQDTVDANRSLGLPDDLREYTAARDVMAHFKIDSVMLMTNNRRKVDCLSQLGIRVSGIIPVVVKPRSAQMKKYMMDKAHRMGHTIKLEE